jgi:hypothetical protein
MLHSLPIFQERECNMLIFIYMLGICFVSLISFLKLMLMLFGKLYTFVFFPFPVQCVFLPTVSISPDSSKSVQRPAATGYEMFKDSDSSRAVMFMLLFLF